MQIKVYPAVAANATGPQRSRCVVELSYTDIELAVRRYAAKRGQRLPAGHTELKRGRTRGVVLMTIHFMPDERHPG